MSQRTLRAAKDRRSAQKFSIPMKSPCKESGLFSSLGLGPRAYRGPPNLRRVTTPSPTKTTTSLPPARSSTSLDFVNISLQDGNASQTAAPNTPRSLEACARVGVRPMELVAPTIEDTLREMRKANEPIADEAIVKMRHAFHIQMQQRKLKAVLETYWELCDEHADTTSDEKTTDALPPPDSSRDLSEERKLRKIIETNKSRLRQQLLRMQLHQKQRQREDERLQAQRMADLNKRDESVRAMAERAKKEEEAAALRLQARELEKNRSASLAEEARRRHEAQDAELKRRLEQRRIALEESNALKRRENRERRLRMKEHHESITEARRCDLESRMEVFEREHRSRRQRREIENARRRCEAEARNAKIQEAIDKSKAQMQARVLAAEGKSAAAERRLNGFARKRFEERMANLEDEMEKEARRQELLEEASRKEQERIDLLAQQMALQDERYKQLEEERASQRRMAKELATQRMLLKQDAVDRRKRVDERERSALLDRVEKKEQRIANMKASHQEMKVRRKLQREEAEKTRITISEVTPGPGDYVLRDGEFGSNSPQWKFGLPASASGPRVVLRSQRAPDYDDSPGPAAYDTANVSESRHRNRAAFSFTKAERFSSTE